jgi:hypothetical protein
MNRYRLIEKRPRRFRKPPVGRTAAALILLTIAGIAFLVTLAVFFTP